MIDAKILLQDLCDNLERELIARDGNSQSVELVSEFREQPINNLWVIEIRLNNNCITQVTHIVNSGEGLDLLEQQLCYRMLRNLFTFGTMSAKATNDYLKN